MGHWHGKMKARISEGLVYVDSETLNLARILTDYVCMELDSEVEVKIEAEEGKVVISKRGSGEGEK